MYDGRTGAEPGLVLGHEPLGVVEQVGESGERPASATGSLYLPTCIAGLCYNCARGYSAACLRVRPGGFGAAYGYAGMGPYRGAQADLLRVPFADANCIPVPGSPGDDLEDDFVLLADAFVTGWHATELARVGTGPGPVAIFGAGAIGLLAAYSSLLKGAGEVYVVDWIERPAGQGGRTRRHAVDFRAGDPVEQIRELRRARGPSPSARRGWMASSTRIDAVGFQARDRARPDTERPTQVIEDLARLVNPTGHVGIAGVYAEKDLRPAPGGSADGTLAVPWATFFSKGVSVGFGRTNDRRYTTLLRDLVVSGRARPGVIVTHHSPLDDAPGLFSAFDRRTDGVIKAVLQP